MRKQKPLPPGTYVATISSVRKVRNKDALRMTFEVEGHKLKLEIKP